MRHICSLGSALFKSLEAEHACHKSEANTSTAVQQVCITLPGTPSISSTTHEYPHCQEVSEQASEGEGGSKSQQSWRRCMCCSYKGLSMDMQELLFDQSLLQMAQKMYRPASHYEPCSQPYQSPADIRPPIDDQCNTETAHGETASQTFYFEKHTVSILY